MDVKQALARLHPADDAHWTTEGQPRIDAVAELVGGKVTRQQITDADPDFSRSKAKVPEAPPLKDPKVTGDEVEFDADLVTDAEEAPKFDAGFVEPEDDVVGMDPAKVYGSVELIDRALAEFERQNTVVCERRERANSKSKELGARCEILQRVRGKLVRVLGKDPASGHNIRQYLDSQNAQRQKRRAAAEAFVGSGTNPKDVAAVLSGSSALDKALNARNNNPAARRPQVPPKETSG